jgi:predicted HAD superfamily Cof-like phosphohydrolase
MSEYTPYKDVAQFMSMCGQEVLDTPTIPSKEILLLRCKLLFEEVREFITGAGCYIDEDEKGNLNNYTSTVNEPDLVEMYDAIIDISYVNYGAAASLGLDVELGFKEVHSSNMSKIQMTEKGPQIIKNEFGKVMKGPDYKKPDLKTVMEHQKK